MSFDATALRPKLEHAFARPHDASAQAELVDAIAEPLRSDSRRSRYPKLLSGLGDELSKFSVSSVIALACAICTGGAINAVDAEFATSALLRAWTSDRDLAMSANGRAGQSYAEALEEGICAAHMLLATDGSAVQACAVSPTTVSAAFDALHMLASSSPPLTGDSSSRAALAAAAEPLQRLAVAYATAALGVSGPGSPGSTGIVGVRVARAVLSVRRLAALAAPGAGAGAWGAHVPEALVMALARACIAHASWMLAEEVVLEISDVPSVRAAALGLIASEAQTRGRLATVGRTLRLLRSAECPGLPEADVSSSAAPSRSAQADAVAGGTLPEPVEMRHLHLSTQSTHDDSGHAYTITTGTGPISSRALAPAHAVGSLLAKTHRSVAQDEAEMTALNVHAADHHERSLVALVARAVSAAFEASVGDSGDSTAALALALGTALTYVGSDPGLHAVLLDQLLLHHRFAEARACVRALSQRWGYDCTVSGDSPSSSSASSDHVRPGQGRFSIRAICAAEASATQAADKRGDTAGATASSVESRYWQVPLRVCGSPATSSEGRVDADAAATEGSDPLSERPARQVTIVQSAADLMSMRSALEAEAVALAQSVLREDRAAHDNSSNFTLIVGVDSEWRPDSLYDARASRPLGADKPARAQLHWPTSILQLATRSSAFIVDLLALHAERSRELAAPPAPPLHLPVPPSALSSVSDTEKQTIAGIPFCPPIEPDVIHKQTIAASRVDVAVASSLGWLWSEHAIAKVGFGVSGDLQRLVESYPCWAAALGVAVACIELGPWMLSAGKALCSRFSSPTRPAGSAAEGAPAVPGTPLGSALMHLGKSLKPPASLNAAVLAAFGQPLNKKQQISDWQQRPLSPAQLAYAAHDAFAAVDIVGAVVAELNRAGCMAGLQGSASTVSCTVCTDTTGSGSMPWIAVTLSLLSPHGAYAPYTVTTTPQRTSACITSTSDVDADNDKASTTICEDVAIPLTTAEVACALRQRGLDPAALLLQVPPAPTAASAAESAGIDESLVVKSLAFVGEAVSGSPAIIAPSEYGSACTLSAQYATGRLLPLLLCIPGDAKVDAKKVALACGVRRSKLRLATTEECLRFFGFIPGTFPPMALRRLPLTPHARVYIHAGIEARLQRAAAGSSGPAYVYAGGGSLHTLLRLTWQQLLLCSGGTVVDIAGETRSSPPSLQPTMPPLPADPVSVGGLSEPATPPLTLSPDRGERQPQAQAADPPHLKGGGGGADLSLSVPKPRFLCDPALGRLVRWLRVVGVDAETTAGLGAEEYATAFAVRHPGVPLHSSVGGQQDVAAAAKSAPESDEGDSGTWHEWRPLAPHVVVDWAARTGRILLTRDKKMLVRRDACALWFVTPNDAQAQFAEVTRHFGINVSVSDLMSRCAKCNGLGYEHLSLAELEATAEGAGVVPDKVKAAVTEFWRCRRCRKVYWEGPKFTDTRERFIELFH